MHDARIIFELLKLKFKSTVKDLEKKGLLTEDSGYLNISKRKWHKEKLIVKEIFKNGYEQYNIPPDFLFDIPESIQAVRFFISHGSSKDFSEKFENFLFSEDSIIHAYYRVKPVSWVLTKYSYLPEPYQKDKLLYKMFKKYEEKGTYLIIRFKDKNQINKIHKKIKEMGDVQNIKYEPFDIKISDVSEDAD
jgi:hypothetical protein